MRFLRGEIRKITAVTFYRQCPLVLQVEIGREQGKALGSEESNVTGSGLLTVCSRGKKLDMWAEFVFGGQH